MLEGSHNTALGSLALYSNSTGNQNMAIGAQALYRLDGTGNIALGFYAGANLISGAYNIYIGNQGLDLDVGTVRIGAAGTHTKTFIAGISGTAVTGTAVVVDGNGQLGVATSSARCKDEIKPMDKASESILALNPVTFRYRKEIDANRTQQFGLVAEDVAKVNRDLVVLDRDGKPYTVRYDAVNAMVLNEFLKEHRKVQEQETIIAQVKSNAANQESTIRQLKKDFRATVAQLTTRLDEQAAEILKVSAQLKSAKAAPRVVNNP